jgi:hypothetical protein
VTFKLLGVHGFRFKKLAAVTHGVMRWGHGAPTLKRRRANAVPQFNNARWTYAQVYMRKLGNVF